MKEEIFGPILPVLTWDKIDQVIDFINEREKPLALYYFGKYMNNPIKERLMRETSSGGFAVNEVLFHGASTELPFGGVGNSGYGKYHGIDGFKALSNPKAVLDKPTLNFYPFTQLYPPYDQSKQKLISLLASVLKGTQEHMNKRLGQLIIVLGLIFGRHKLVEAWEIVKIAIEVYKKRGSAGQGGKL